jgi:hypothetical protein
LIFANKNIKFVVLFLGLFLISCHPVSHIIIGNIKEPISPIEVKLYIEFPSEYETIALIEASSEFAFKDPSIDITWQDKTDKIIERLKIEASKLGANGIVIKKTDDKNKQNIALDDEGEAYINTIHYKVATATAIFVE